MPETLTDIIRDRDDWEANAQRYEAENQRLHDALYNAHAFIEKVTHWDGQQDDQEEILAEISGLLPDERKTDG